MPRCCQTDRPPKINQGRHISVTGTGSTQDPLTVSATTTLDVEPTEVFNLVLEGDGTLESPWRLRVEYGANSRLDDIPDVDASDVPNGYVLARDRAAGTWKGAPPSVAAPGSVNRGVGLAGDGSASNPLVVVGNPERYIAVTAAGIGLSDAGLNATVRAFDTAAARNSASPPPILGALSIVGTNPDQLDRWDGAEWQPVTGGNRRAISSGQQLLALSGDYTGGSTARYVAQLSVTTDATGGFEVIGADDLAGYSGVLSCVVAETGATPWKAMIRAGTDNMVGTAYRLTNGNPYANVALTGTVDALLY